MKIGSLFSGIGGLELGIIAENPGADVVWQAECDPYALAVLERHFPSIHRYKDVREIDASAARVDVVCGGFPCQDVSTAGKGAGLTGERSGLWWEFRRIVRTLRPSFASLSKTFTAAGADGCRQCGAPYGRSGMPACRFECAPATLELPTVARDVFFLPTPCASPVGDEPGRPGGTNGSGAAVAIDNGAPGIAADVRSIGEREQEPTGARPWAATWGAPVSGRDQSPPWIASDTNRGWELQPGGSVTEQWRWTRHADGWAFEPPVPGMDDGTSGRVDRERLCGNAVVPQAAALAWRTLIAHVANLPGSAKGAA